MTIILLTIVTVLAVSPSCTAFAPMRNAGRKLAMPSAFAGPAVSTTPFIESTALKGSPVDLLDLGLNLNNVGSGDMGTDAAVGMVASSSIILSETEAWVQPLSLVLGPFLSLFSLAMLCRIVLSWYPSANVNEFPFNIVVWPTEPLLRLVRGSVPPAFGVDITPVVWLGLFTFMNEILLGQQGLLTMKMKYGI